MRERVHRAFLTFIDEVSHRKILIHDSIASGHLHYMFIRVHTLSLRHSLRIDRRASLAFWSPIYLQKAMREWSIGSAAFWALL